MNTQDEKTSEESKNEQEEISKPKKRWREIFGFWNVFVATLVLLAAGTFILYYMAIKNQSASTYKNEEAELENLFDGVFKTANEHAPQLLKIESEIGAKTLNDINKTIDENIDKAFAPLYAQIDKFSDFHYSVTGEYTELATLATKDAEAILQKYLFGPAHFDKNLEKALTTINGQNTQILENYFEKLQDSFQKELGFNEKQMEMLFTNVLQLTKEDLKKRFTQEVAVAFRVVGVGASAAVMAKVASKQIATVMAKKLAAKVATKAALKGGAKAAGVLAGAETGAIAGVACGPAAPVCSTVAGITGAIVGWFATDKVVVEADRALHEEEFKENLRKLIDKQKYIIKKGLYQAYAQAFIKTNKELDKKLDEIKNKPIIDQIN